MREELGQKPEIFPPEKEYPWGARGSNSRRTPPTSSKGQRQRGQEAPKGQSHGLHSSLRRRRPGAPGADTTQRMENGTGGYSPRREGDGDWRWYLLRRPGQTPGRAESASSMQGEGCTPPGPCSLLSHRHAHTQREAWGYGSRLCAGQRNLPSFKKD